MTRPTALDVGPSVNPSATADSSHTTTSANSFCTSTIFPSVMPPPLHEPGSGLDAGLDSSRELLLAVALFNIISPDQTLTERAKQIWTTLSQSSGSLEKQLVKEASVLATTLRNRTNFAFSPQFPSIHGKARKVSSPASGTSTVSHNGSSAQNAPSVLDSSPVLTVAKQPQPSLRIYADGVFDLMHSGHFNALRQAKLLGDRLVVGVCSDGEVEVTKGVAPIYSQEERAELVRGCRWVDDVVEGTPYNVSMAFLAKMECDYVAHGDDVAPNADGTDCYAEPAAAGRLKTFRRTMGISSTTLICRLLWATADITAPHMAVDPPKPIRQWLAEEGVTSIREGKSETPAQRLLQFIGDRKQPRPSDHIVYVDGSFDIFHVGHLRILQKAKKLGDYLIVGIYDDETVASVKGPGFPVMNVMERALNVLAMQVVDEVILGAPWVVTEKLLRGFGVNTVVCGRQIDATGMKHSLALVDESCLPRVDSSDSSAIPQQPGSDNDKVPGLKAEQDCYKVAKQMGIFVELDSESSITTVEIIKRVVKQREPLLKTILSRSKKELNTQINCRPLSVEGT